MSGEPRGKALVSGGTGFIGRHLATVLSRRGREVIVPTRQTDVPDPVEGVTYLRLDLGNRADIEAASDALPGVETFFHLASDVAWTTEFSLAGLRSLRTQVEHPLLLLEALLPSLRGVVLASSVMVYPFVSEGLLREDRDEAPPNFYGAHKLVLEQAGALWARRTGLRFVAARIGQVYGESMRVNRFLLDTITKALHGEDITVFGDGTPTVDWLHVDDVVGALLRCESAQSGAYNVGTGRGLSNLELAREIVRILGAGSHVALAPDRPVPPRHQVLDVRRAAEGLGWTAETSLDTGIGRLGGARNA